MKCTVVFCDSQSDRSARAVVSDERCATRTVAPRCEGLLLSVAIASVVCATSFHSVSPAQLLSMRGAANQQQHQQQKRAAKKPSQPQPQPVKKNAGLDFAASREELQASVAISKQ